MSAAERSVPVRCRRITGTKIEITVDVSAKNVLPTFLLEIHVTSFVKIRDWLTVYDVRGCVLCAGRLAVALKAEKPGPVHSVDKIPGRSEVGSSSQPAVHSNQFPGHPLPLLPTQCRVHKGGTESDKSSFYVVNT